MERKLAAILSADVQGYSRLMGDDEEATIRTLTTYREVMTSLIQQHRGRVVDSPGDNLLAEFVSAVDAVQGAVAIQKELKTRNAELPESRQMHYRIGINVGDVVVEGERIYGDGVNIAARIESLADGGGISISEAVHMQVKNKLDLSFTSQGEQSVKNIADPVRVYKVELEAEATPHAAVLEQPTELPLPDKPSIAVLPFTNMSNDPEQEYFSDGMTDDIITDLSKISGLFVIARHSTFTYKGQAVKVADVGRELGVRHVLEGSVRKAGNRIRINVQLIDASSGGHLWAERYDRELTDFFALQDEITHKIVFALKVTLTPEEQGRLRQVPTADLEAYECFQRGDTALGHSTLEMVLEARQLYEQAIARDPAYASAYAALGYTHYVEWVFQWSPNPPQSLQRAVESAQKAISLNESLALPHLVLSFVLMWQRHLPEARAEAEQVLHLSPNFSDGYFLLGHVASWAGQPDEALGFLEQAMRLNPHFPAPYLTFLGHTYYLLGRYEEAITIQRKVLAHNPDFLPTHAFLAVAYFWAGHQEEARKEVAEIRRINPQFSTELLSHRLPYQEQEKREVFLEALRKSGLE